MKYNEETNNDNTLPMPFTHKIVEVVLPHIIR